MGRVDCLAIPFIRVELVDRVTFGVFVSAYFPAGLSSVSFTLNLSLLISRTYRVTGIFLAGCAIGSSDHEHLLFDLSCAVVVFTNLIVFRVLFRH